MKRLNSMFLFLSLAAALQAQSTDTAFRYRHNSHVYFTIGACQHGYSQTGIGGGAEAFVWRGLVLGGDIGYHKFTNSFGFGLGDVNVGYHFVNRNRPARFDPFVNFSPAGFYVTGNGKGFNGGFGGGLNYWFKEKIGLRTEVRAHALLPAEEAVLLVRIGVNFR